MIEPILLPAQVDWVWFAVAGSTWPEANEDEISSLAEQWQRVVDALGDRQQPLAADLAGVSSTYGGATGQEFRFASYDILGYGSDSGLLPLQQAARDRQLAAQLGALDFGLTKASMNLEVIVTAISVLYATIMASISLGTSGASIPALVATGRNRAMQLAGDLVRRLGSREGFSRLTREGARAAIREGMQEVAEEGFIAGGGQAWQLATGQRDWGEVDVGRIALASGAGFAGGAGGTMIFGDNFAGLGNLYRLSQLRELSGRRFRDLLIPAAIRFGEGFVHNPVASGIGTTFSWLATGGDGDLWQMLKDGALSAAVVGGTRPSLTLVGGQVGGRFNPVQYDPQTGLFAPRAGGPWDLSRYPDRAGQLQDILIQASLPADAGAVLSPHLAITSPEGARPPSEPESGAALLTSSPPDRPLPAWQAEVDQTVRQTFDGRPLDGQRQLQVEYAVPSERGTLVGMTVVDPDGTAVGSMTRMFGRDPDGTPYVAQISTALPGGSDHHPSWQVALDPHLQDAYRELGFHQVRLLPGAGDGAAAAAAGAGFAPGAEEAVARMRGELVRQLDGIAANRDLALDATLAGWLGVPPDQPATETERQVAELLVDSQVAAAQELLARMPEPAWQPTPQELLATGILGVAALNGVGWSAAVPLAPAGSPPGAARSPAGPAPGSAWSATAAWLERPDVHHSFDGQAGEFRIIDGRVWLVEPGATSAERTVVGPPGEALEVAQVFLENPDLGYLVRRDGLVVAGRQMALALLTEAVRASTEPAAEPAATARPDPARREANPPATAVAGSGIELVETPGAGSVPAPGARRAPAPEGQERAGPAGDQDGAAPVGTESAGGSGGSGAAVPASAASAGEPARVPLTQLVVGSAQELGPLSADLAETLRDAFRGRRFGAGDYTVELRQTAAGDPDLTVEPGQTIIRHDVYDPPGNRVGGATFLVGMDRDGSVYVEHVRIRLQPEHRRGGFLRSWHEYLEGWARESGVRGFQPQAGTDHLVGPAPPGSGRAELGRVDVDRAVAELRGYFPREWVQVSGRSVRVVAQDGTTVLLRLETRDAPGAAAEVRFDPQTHEHVVVLSSELAAQDTVRTLVSRVASVVAAETGGRPDAGALRELDVLATERARVQFELDRHPDAPAAHRQFWADEHARLTGEFRQLAEQLGIVGPEGHADTDPRVRGRRDDVWAEISDGARALLFTLADPANAVGASAKARTFLPLTDAFREPYDAIDALVYFIEEHAPAEVRRRFEAELLPEIRRFQAEVLERFKVTYREFFPSTSAERPLPPDRADQAREQVSPLVDEVRATLDKIHRFIEAADSPELRQSDFDRAVELGEQAWRERYEQFRAAIDHVLTRFSYTGEPLGYIGSMQDGMRGPHKAMTHADLRSFDVDLYVVHPDEYDRLYDTVRAHSPDDVTRGKIFPSSEHTPELFDTVVKVRRALKRLFPDNPDIAETTIALRREPPY